MTAYKDDFDFFTVGTGDLPFQGYASQPDPTTVAPNIMVEGSKNVVRQENGAITVRDGLKLLGDVDGDSVGIASSYEWATSVGKQRPLWVRDDGKVQVRFENELYDIRKEGSSDSFPFADRTRAVFAPWWDGYNGDGTVGGQQKDLLTIVNGTHSIWAWDGGVGRITGLGTSGTVVSVAIDSAGTGYDDGDLISIDGGTGARVLVQTVGGGGNVTVLISSIIGGYGYTPGTYVATTTPITGVGTGLTLTITVQNLNTITIDGTFAENGFYIPYVESITSIDLSRRDALSGSTNITYDNVDGDTMYGIPDIGSIVVGDVLLSALFETENTPSEDFTNDFIVTVTNQLVVGSYTSRIIYFSADTNYLDFTNSGDVITGDPDFIILDDLPKGMIAVEQSVYISAGTNAWYIATPNTAVPVQQPLGANFKYVIIEVQKKVGATKSAALAHEFISAMGEDVVYLDQGNQIRSFGIFRDVLGTRIPYLSQQIKRELSEEDFTGGSLRAIDDRIFAIAPISGRVYIYRNEDNVDNNGNIVGEKFFEPYQEWNITRVAVIDGVQYGYSNQYPQAYQLFNTDQYHDDTPSGPMPYPAVLRLGYWNSGKRSKLLDFDKIYTEGYIDPNSELTLTVRSNWLGSTAIEDAVVSALDDNPALFQTDAVVIGGQIIGQEVIGGGTQVEGETKFRNVSTLTKHQCFEYQIELSSFSLDSFWSILCVGSNASLVTDKPVYITHN